MMEGSIASSSTLSTPTPTTSSSSPAAASVFRPRRSEDWNKYRSYIESLYRDDQLKLRDVKRIMEREHKFVASEKQYKDRLAAWNIRKNIKAKEVNIMIRKQQKRAARGKQTVFKVAGQKVDPKRFTRFVRRYGNIENHNNNESHSHTDNPHAESPEPATPSDMSYYTPPPDERPTTLSPQPENTFHHIDSVPVSELDGPAPLPAALSPTSYHTEEEFVKQALFVSEHNALSAFQDRLNMLSARLDRDTAEFWTIEEARKQEEGQRQH
ncbi:Clr5 domain-containing protein [Aspergillus egyptiacus]|nr:Clr5 domain-containing protein [Aspergillus egyptiacus]